MDIIIWYLFWGLLPWFIILYIITTYILQGLKGLIFKNINKIK